MSQPGSDAEVIELSVNFSGLSITVRGSPDRAADFVRGLSDRGSPSTSHHDPSLDLSAAAPSPVASFSSPNRSEAIELQNKFWCVVFCQGVSCPRVFTSSRAFFGAVGPVEGSTTICHAFPSETEARVYLEGAGLEFPDVLN